MTDIQVRRGRPPKNPPFQAASALDIPDGWEPFVSAPKDGTFIRAAADIEDGYTIVRWKRTRVMICGRWLADGYWVDELNRKIGFAPRYFQPRHGVG